MLILSLDPASYRNCGWGKLVVIDKKIVEYDAGTFVTENQSELWQYCWPIFEFVDNLIATVLPDIVIVEKTSSFRSKFAFISGQISNCMGVIYASCGKHKKEIQYIFPTHAKKILIGKGKATKTEMKKAVINALKDIQSNAKISSEHAYDALGNAIVYAKENLGI